MISTSDSFVLPAIFNRFPALFAAETTRHGGLSPVPFASLNLGNFTEDSAANIDANRSIVLNAAGFDANSLVFARQVHGDQVFLAGHSGSVDGYDALITATKGLLLGVTVADCTPILIYDAKHEVAAAIHAGWKGTVAQITSKTLATMSDHFGTSGKDCFAYIGTCIDECDFEVGDEVAAQFANKHKQFFTQKNKYHVNLKAANQQQLLDFGIPLSQIEVSPRSTFTAVEDYFSFRAEKGVTGRFMGIIGMRKSLLLLLFTILGICSSVAHAQTVHQLLKDANAKYAEGDFQAAKNAYAQANEVGFSNGKGTYNLGNAAYQLNQYAEAAEQYLKSMGELWADKDKANASYNAANAYYQLKAYDKSIELYKQALRYNPNDMDAKKNLSLCRKMQQNQQNQQNNSPNAPPPDSNSKKSRTQQSKEKNDSGSSTVKNDLNTLDPQELERLLKVIAEEDKITRVKSQKSNTSKTKKKSGKDW
ncbi:MAG: peptidoglycan editing factor PgeF [Saprospiraceae bacterium]